MSCSNCFSGCVEITSDKCVRYTGEDISELGISNGDSLLSVEQKIIQYLVSALDGTGIEPNVSPSVLCDIIQSNLPAVGPFTLNDYLTGLIKALCEIDDKVTTLENENPNTEYTLECLTVSDNTNTHDVLQAVITKLCAVETDLDSFISLVDATYVKISDINTYIANYLSTDPSANLISNRMAPYAITAYAGPLTNFDASGAGVGNWNKIYLCNGNNGTLDLRGRVLVGATAGMGGGTMSSAVDPAVSGNPAYTLGSTTGDNSVVLTEGQIPSHSHIATTTAVLSPDTHSHLMVSLGSANTTDPPTATNQVRQSYSTGGNLGYAMRGTSDAATRGLTGEVTQTVSVSVSNADTGGNQGHQNYQPGTGVYYIIYIP